jgi:uncharacterized OB-fold protein
MISNIYFPHEDGITLTATTIDPRDYYAIDSVLKSEEHEHIRYFNCKRCGAVGQQGKCEYCGSAEEGEPND